MSQLASLVASVLIGFVLGGDLESELQQANLDIQVLADKFEALAVCSGIGLNKSNIATQLAGDSYPMKALISKLKAVTVCKDQQKTDANSKYTLCQEKLKTNLIDTFGLDPGWADESDSSECKWNNIPNNTVGHTEDNNDMEVPDLTSANWMKYLADITRTEEVGSFLKESVYGFSEALTACDAAETTWVTKALECNVAQDEFEMKFEEKQALSLGTWDWQPTGSEAWRRLFEYQKVWLTTEQSSEVTFNIDHTSSINYASENSLMYSEWALESGGLRHRTPTDTDDKTTYFTDENNHGAQPSLLPVVDGVNALATLTTRTTAESTN